jgi:hypothetical protein
MLNLHWKQQRTTYIKAFSFFSCSLSKLLSDGLLCPMTFERVFKPVSTVDMQDTAHRLLKISWTACLVKSSPMHFSILLIEAIFGDEITKSFVKPLSSGIELSDVFCRVNLFRYAFRQSCCVSDSSSSSISMTAVRKALRCESLKGKVWIKCSNTNPRALVRVADVRCARPCFFIQQSNHIVTSNLISSKIKVYKIIIIIIIIIKKEILSATWGKETLEVISDRAASSSSNDSW